MAEVPVNQSVPSGYDEQFVNPPDEDMLCIICFLPSKEPVLTRCGHKFCRQCLEEHIRRQELGGGPLTCPTDREALERNKDIFPDKSTERRILSLIIKCPSKGCEWTGELREKEKHLDSCPLSMVSCTNEKCEIKVARKDLAEHVTNTCVWKILKCRHCEENHPQCQMEAHLENCEGLLTGCPNNCGIKILKEKVSDHVKNTCPLTEVPCPYNWMGCTSKVQREVLESHLQCETGHHLNLSCCKLNGTQDEMRKLQTEVRELRERENIRHNEIEERDQARQNHSEERAQAIENRFEERVQGLQNHFEERVNVLTDINHKLKGDLNTTRIALFFCSAVLVVIIAVLLGRLEAKLEEQINGVQNKLTRKVGEVEKIMEFKVTDVRGQLMKDMNKVKKSLQVKMEDLEERIERYPEENCDLFTWKMTNFGEALRKAKSGWNTLVDSPPFYACGYKCSLNLIPKGSKSGEHTHLSIYIRILKGENDAILTWPFQKKVQVRLIDQQENANDRKDIVMSFSAHNEPECFGKPVNDENQFGCGFPQFVSHENLLERRYVVDDAVFFQVRIMSSSTL